MNGPEHYAEAEKITVALERGEGLGRDQALALAQVHATLALTAAQMDTALPLTSTGRQKWRTVLGWNKVQS